VQATIVKLGELLEDCMGRMMAGTKYVPQLLGKLMQILFLKRGGRSLKLNRE
jgi:hypothetical protein